MPVEESLLGKLWDSPCKLFAANNDPYLPNILAKVTYSLFFICSTISHGFSNLCEISILKRIFTVSNMSDITLYLPIPHTWVIYGAVALLVEMAIGFAVEVRRGVLALSSLNAVLPIRGPTRSWNPAAAFIASLVAVFLYPFYGAPMTTCHSQSSYLKRPRVKAIAHALIWWGFVLAAVSTVLGFLYDRWIPGNVNGLVAFIPGGRLGPAGPYAVMGAGAAGGLLIIAGFALMMIARWQGTRPISEPAITDFFLWIALFVVLSGFALMGVELGMPTNYYALATAFSIHILLVAIMFATMPWTKFGHAIYMYVWQVYDRYRSWRGMEPRLLGPWSGELAERSLHSHHPAHKPKVTG